MSHSPGTRLGPYESPGHLSAPLVDDRGFLITAYPTDAIKEGTPIWPK